MDARVTTTISPCILERLAEVLVDQGDLVKSVQLLARLDDAETRQQVAISGSSILQLVATNEIWISAWVDKTAMTGLKVAQSVRGSRCSLKPGARQYGVA